MMFWRRGLLFLCLASLAAPASSQTGPTSIPSMGDQPGVMWLIRPDAIPVGLFYPEAANDQFVAGRVRLECTPRIDQRIDCRTVSETPAGWGFGEAAVAASRSYRMQANMRGGHIIGSPHVAVNLAFSPYHEDSSASADALDLPQWEAAPNADAVRAAWPEGASHPNVRGRATLSCTVTQDRALSCTLVRESQTGLGLGRAALALAPQFRVLASESAFVERHRATPFLLPVNFGFAPSYEPISRVTTGETSVVISPPAAVVSTVYPPRARAAHISGVAIVTCTARSEGAPNCVLKSEAPAGQGFGDAALMLANAAMAMSPNDALLPGDQIEIRVPFDAPAADAAH